jgi:hypothetical protein
MFSQLPAAPAAALHAAYIVGSAPAAMVQPGDNLQKKNLFFLLSLIKI